jgi:hypothetical protein
MFVIRKNSLHRMANVRRKEGRMRNFTLLFFLGLAFAGLAHAAPQRGDKIFPSTGVALTPANFPNHSAKDVEDMFRIGKDLGDTAVFIYQWSQPDLQGTAQTMLKLSKQNNYTAILAISPTKLAGMRGEFDLPESVSRVVGRKVSFADKSVYEPYINDVLELAKLHPPYLCLATEINLLAFSSIKEYITFAAVYKKLYPVIKKISPSTQVFVSFQWDFFQLMDEKEPNKIAEHSKLIDIFRPELDLIAFTSYPADHFSSPSAVPANYYEQIYQHIKRDDPVMFMEIGWPSTGKGSEQSQLAFINRLPSLMEKVKPKVLAWSLLHDVPGALGGDLGSTGLLTTRGQAKPGFEAFKALRNK